MNRFAPILATGFLLVGGAAFQATGQQQHQRPGVELDDLRITNSRGSVQLQDIKATRATVSPDMRAAELVTLVARIASVEKDPGEPIDCSAPKAEVVLQGEKPPSDPPAGPVTLELLASIAAREDGVRFRGDFVLLSEGDSPVVMSAGQRGRVEASEIHWSEEHRRLAGWGPFRQLIVTPEGSEMVLTGSAFTVDSTLREWTYFTRGDNPVSLTVEPTATSTATTPESIPQ